MKNALSETYGVITFPYFVLILITSQSVQMSIVKDTESLDSKVRYVAYTI